ncbi:MAG: thymidylate synthase (FAD) [Deltaproteobacteria bacterium]|nr:MAG: thymidylate synthase (FAD) [Deltaproteobacteria bacterium]
MHQAKALIINYTPEPERICAASARISSTPGTATQIYTHTRRENIGKLIEAVVRMGHKTITEHAVFTIAFENVSAFYEQFLIEFRLAAYTIKSRRYVDYTGMGFFTPDYRFSPGKTAAETAALKTEINTHFQFLFDAYQDLLQMEIPKEDARFLLPYAFRSHIYCTLNARELMHIIYASIRGRGAAYPEIKAMGEQLLAQATKILPDVFSLLDRVEAGREDKEARLGEILGPPAVDAYADAGERSELITSSENPELAVAAAAVTGHTGLSTKAAIDRLNQDPATFDRVLDVVTTDRRKRELEQAAFMFRIRNLSLAGLTHLARHRIQSLMVPSFTQFGKSKTFVLPQTLIENRDAADLYTDAVRTNYQLFHRMLAEGLVPEDGVYLYNAGNVLDVITTMNARELYHFLRLRTCNRAQWEIRGIAIDMLKKLRSEAPRLFNRVGPACFMDGNCPEGKFTCGKAAEIKKIFGSLDLEPLDPTFIKADTES